GDAEPVADTLRGARLVALSGRTGADRYGDRGLWRDLHRCPLMRRAARRFDVAPGAYAAAQAHRHRSCTARLEAAPVGERDGIIEDFLVEAAVMGYAERMDVGKRVGRE